MIFTRKKYQKAAGTVVGTFMEALESYGLQEQARNTVKRIAWGAMDREFSKFIDDGDGGGQ